MRNTKNCRMKVRWLSGGRAPAPAGISFPIWHRKPQPSEQERRPIEMRRVGEIERDRQKCRGTCDHRLTPADQGTNADDASRALAKIPATTHLTMYKREGRDSDSQRRIFSLARLFLRRVRKINDVLGLTSPFLSGLTKQLPLTRDFVKKDGGREGRSDGGWMSD